MGMSLPYFIVFVAGSVLGWIMLDAGQPAPLVIWLVTWAIGYFLSIHLHPRRPCWACGGEARQWGRFFRYSVRPCSRCAGKGWEMRWGAKMLDIDHRGTLNALRRQRGSGSPG
jgi:hypothetical protein